MIRIVILFLAWIATANAEIVKVENRGVADEHIKCEWNNQEGVPCVTIRPNANKFSNKISNVIIIKKTEIEKNNLFDLRSVLNFVDGLNITQSGPTGQQTSVFMRGTNSNHTLVLLNGIPINDQSTTNGAFDFGQDFMSNVTLIEVYKGSSGAHFGADSIGGAVNLITTVDHDNRLSFNGKNGGQSLKGNYTKITDTGWQINVQGGVHEEETESALKGGTDTDGVKNKSASLNIIKWLSDKLMFRTNIFTRNTLADLDGHSLALQNGYDADNSLYAFQTGLDFTTVDTQNYITFHTHEYDRDYNSPNNELDEYDSNAYAVRAEHKKIGDGPLTYGVGFEYKYDEAVFTNRGSYNSTLSGDYENQGYFANLGYQITDGLSTSLNYRTDNNNVVGNNDAYKIGILKENVLPNLDVRLNHSTGYKNPSLYELYGADNYAYQGNVNLDAEQSETNEIMFDYNFSNNSMFSINFFETNISNLISYSYPTYVNDRTGKLKQSGVEMAYSYIGDTDRLTLFSNSLSSKKADGNDQLRRPETILGFNYAKDLDNGFGLITNYKFKGEHLDVHNSNYSTITMKELHMLDLTITKKYFNYDLGVNISNLFDEDYESPHGFSQEGLGFNFVIKSRF